MLIEKSRKVYKEKNTQIKIYKYNRPPKYNENIINIKHK